MSVRMESYLLQRLGQMLALSFETKNIFWSSIKAMQKRHVGIRLLNAINATDATKCMLTYHVFEVNNKMRKYIICSNVPSRRVQIKDSLS